MAALGIKAKELDNVSYETVKLHLQQREKKKNIPTVLVDLRYENLQKKRQEKRQLIIEEREKIMWQDEYKSTQSNQVFLTAGLSDAGSINNMNTPRIDG
jgi:hypothetical protein